MTRTVEQRINSWVYRMFKVGVKGGEIGKKAEWPCDFSRERRAWAIPGEARMVSYRTSQCSVSGRRVGTRRRG